MYTLYKDTIYEKRYGGFGIVDHQTTKKSLYTTKDIQKGAIELYFGEAIEQPLEKQNLLVGRTYEEAEYQRLNEEKRKQREAYIMRFERRIYDNVDSAKKLIHTNIYEVSKIEPAIAKTYIKTYLTSSNLYFQEQNDDAVLDVVRHHPHFGTMVFTRHRNSSRKRPFAPADNLVRTPAQEATYWILRRYSEEQQNRLKLGGLKLAADGKVLPTPNTIPVTWNPTEGDETGFYSSFAAKCSILQTLGYYVFDHATFYNQKASIKYSINKPLASNNLRTLYIMPSNSDGYAATANMREQILLVSRTKPANQYIAGNVEQDLLSLIGQWHHKDEWTIRYGTATNHEQFLVYKPGDSSHLHFFVQDEKHFPTDTSLFFFAQAFGGKVEEALKAYKTLDQQRFAVLGGVQRYVADEKNNNNNMSPLKKRKLEKELLVPHQHVYYKNDKQVMEFLGTNLGWSLQYEAWILEIPTLQPVEIGGKALDRKQLEEARARTGFCIGDQVKAYFKKNERWYPATVTAVGTSTVQIRWDDGDKLHTTQPIQGDKKPEVVTPFDIPPARYADTIPLHQATGSTEVDRALKLREKVTNLFTVGVVDPLYVGSRNGTPHDTLDGLSPSQFFENTNVSHPVLTGMINEPIEHTHANLMLSPYERDYKFCDDTTLCVHTKFNRDVRCYPRFYAMVDIDADTPLTWVYSDGADNPLYKIGYLPHGGTISEKGNKSYVTYLIGNRQLSVAMDKEEAKMYKEKKLPLLDTMRFYRSVDARATLSNLFPHWQDIQHTKHASQSYCKKEMIAFVRSDEELLQTYEFDQEGQRNNVKTYNIWVDEKEFHTRGGEGREHLGLLVATRNIVKGERLVVSKR